MTRPEPVAEVMESGDAPAEIDPAAYPATPWERARQRLAEADTYWLGTVGPGARPQIRPVLAVWVDDALHFCASDTSRKAKNLARNPQCVLTTDTSGLHLVLEGRVSKLADQARLGRVAEAYASKYGWRPEVRDRGLWADGAPTAGPPPYYVYEVGPVVAFGFPTDDESVPTRWGF